MRFSWLQVAFLGVVAGTATALPAFDKREVAYIPKLEVDQANDTVTVLRRNALDSDPLIVVAEEKWERDVVVPGPNLDTVIETREDTIWEFDSYWSSEERDSRPKHHHKHDHGREHRHSRTDIDWTPQTRNFEWNITYGQSAPDGFEKKRILINGQSPGPAIEANEGDTIVVKVNNHLDVGTSIHWHGMYQNSTPFMDGIPGFSQCPIPVGGSLTYEFKIEGQYGSYWYHSHSAMQYTDGMYGPLIVHSQRDPYQIGTDYDEERIIMFADNYHDFANDIVNQLLSVKGYNGSAAAPSPQSGLINGCGVFNCSLLNSNNTKPGTKCTQLQSPTMDIESGKKYRFRFINTGSHAQHIISIDQHELEVISADGTPVKRHKVHRIPLHNGQRHDAIVHFDQGHTGDSFLLRSTMMTACFAFVDPLLDPVANLTLQYTKPDSQVQQKPPVPNDWKDALGTECVDLDDSELVPAIDTSIAANTDPNSLGIFTSQFGNLVLTNGSTLGRFFVDQKTHVNYINQPYLEMVHAGKQINQSTVASLLVPDNLWVADIVINNNDSFLDHPFHLHGPDMHVIARGQGILTADQWKLLNTQNTTGLSSQNATGLNLQNPLRRDTISVARSSWAVIRIFADLPGVWPLHCHIAMHVAEGLMAAVGVHPEKIKALPFSQDVLNQCPSSGPTLFDQVPA